MHPPSRFSLSIDDNDLLASRFRRALLALCLVAGACGNDSGEGTSRDLASGHRPDLRSSARDMAHDGAATDDLASSDDAAESDDAGLSTDDLGESDLAGADLTGLDLSGLDLSATTPDQGVAACGVCPKGYSCGSANGVPVCRAPSGVPLFDHVFVVMMENTSWSTLDASNNTPYLHSLKTNWAYGTDYHGVTHPSLPNYVALTSGSPQGIGCDCDPVGTACNPLTCNVLLSSCGCAQNAGNLGDDLETAGLDWRAYGESMGTPCNTTSAGSYAARHVPFLYYNSIQTNQARCNAHVVDYGAFAADLAGTPKAFSFIAPNLTDDMHDPIISGPQNLANGDNWLQQEMPFVLASPAFTKNGLLIIVWDEDDLSGLLAPDDPIPMFLLSPLAKTGYASSTHADHYALLATIEDGLNLPRLGNAAQATPLTDYFPAQ